MKLLLLFLYLFCAELYFVKGTFIHEIHESFANLNPSKQNIIELSHKHLQNQDIIHLIERIKTSLLGCSSSLVLRDCGLGDENALAIVDTIKELTEPQSLSLAANRISAAGCRELFLKIGGVLSLKELDLSLNPLGGSCGESGALQALPALMKGQRFPCTSLKLAYCGLDTRNCRMLASALAKAGPNSTLTHLDLTGNPLGDAGAAALASGLKQGAGCGLQHLTLSKCKISDRGAEALAATFKEVGGGCTLKHLDLSYNKIEMEGAASFGLSLRHGCGLETLNLSNNPLGDEGVRALAVGLLVRRQRKRPKGGRDSGQSNQKPEASEKPVDELKLVELRLRGVEMTAAGARGLARALRTNPPLKKLDLSGNPKMTVSEESFNKGALQETISSVKSLTSDLKKTKVPELFDLQKLQNLSNRVTTEGMKIAGKLISNAAEGPPDLWKLCGARQLFKSLQHNSNLEVLTLCASGLKRDVVLDILHLMKGDEGGKPLRMLSKLDVRMNGLPDKLTVALNELLQLRPDERQNWTGLDGLEEALDGEDDNAADLENNYSEDGMWEVMEDEEYYYENDEYDYISEGEIESENYSDRSSSSESEEDESQLQSKKHFLQQPILDEYFDSESELDEDIAEDWASVITDNSEDDNYDEDY